MPTPAVRASTQKKARDIDERVGSNELMRAIAETIQAGSEGRKGLEKISERLQAQERSQHAKRMKSKK